MKDERYQYQKWWVKGYRQLRYKPKWVVCFLLHMGLWCIKGCRVPSELAEFVIMSRKEYVQHIWMLDMAMADSDMQYYYTSEEVLSSLKMKTGIWVDRE